MDNKDKIACTAVVGEKGQIVIPKQAREMFDIKAGDTLLILCDKARGIAIPPKQAFNEISSKIFSDSKENK